MTSVYAINTSAKKYLTLILILGVIRDRAHSDEMHVHSIQHGLALAQAGAALIWVVWTIVMTLHVRHVLTKRTLHFRTQQSVLNHVYSAASLPDLAGHNSYSILHGTTQ